MSNDIEAIKHKEEDTREECFVIMPIGELSDNPPNHFLRVYEDIFKPAIEKAGFKPNRADDNKSSNMIQVEIIKRITSAPMALCDLSSRNPNVLFELGIRQAFDLPVVLVQEIGTPKIFDITTINTVDYRKERIYHEVLEDVKKISTAIKATKEDSLSNSIIKLLNITEANVKSIEKIDENQEIRYMLKSLMQDVNELRKNEMVNEHYIRNNSIAPTKTDKIIRDIINLVNEVSNDEFDFYPADVKSRYITKATYYMDYLLNTNLNSKNQSNQLREQLKVFLNKYM